MIKAHSFHIPVMGIGYTIDTPLKVSHLGIDSVISLVDDILIEKLRKFYSEKFNLPYFEIPGKALDSRAKRITSYLNMLNDLAEKKFEELKNNTFEKGQKIADYFNNLPEVSSLKTEFENLKSRMPGMNEIIEWARESVKRGSIDVNIMTKVDKTNYVKGMAMPVEFNDAHAALRGFANSDLDASIVLSAGMNPRLFAYMEKFSDFYPDEDGRLKKRIVLKVSDFKSALIQGKYLAKKGLWVSEYRVESGLNCGGHAFATEGYLMGPILAEFRDRREELIFSVDELYKKALENKGLNVPGKIMPLRVTAQGGVGTAEEHEFLLDEYKLDSVGWGSPFLLVPEATTVDKDTLKQLEDAKEKDLYLSNISPLGVPFNNMRNNTKDKERDDLIKEGKPGSVCPKKFVMLNTELSKKGLCTASRTYQQLKLRELESKNLSPEYYEKEYAKITEKSCICVGLGTSAMTAYDIDTTDIGPGVSACPGPNMAYYSKTISLKNMIDHIYGRANVISRNDRPHVFIKELHLYVDFLKNKINELTAESSKKETGYLERFTNNITEGINYYKELFNGFAGRFHETKDTILSDLENNLRTVMTLKNNIDKLKPAVVTDR